MFSSVDLATTTSRYMPNPSSGFASLPKTNFSRFRSSVFQRGQTVEHIPQEWQSAVSSGFPAVNSKHLNGQDTMQAAHSMHFFDSTIVASVSWKLGFAETRDI
jgi:hypothetical protein